MQMFPISKAIIIPGTDPWAWKYYFLSLQILREFTIRILILLVVLFSVECKYFHKSIIDWFSEQDVPKHNFQEMCKNVESFLKLKNRNLHYSFIWISVQ